MMEIKIGDKVKLKAHCIDDISRPSVVRSWAGSPSRGRIAEALATDNLPTVIDMRIDDMRVLWVKLQLGEIVWFVDRDSVIVLSPLEKLAIECIDEI